MITPHHLSIIGLITLLSGAAYIMHSKGRAVIDLFITIDIVYIYLITFFAEKRIKLPKPLNKVYQNRNFEIIAISLYLPAILMTYVIGFNYGNNITYIPYVYTLLHSVNVGLIISFILYLINDILPYGEGLV